MLIAGFVVCRGSALQQAVSALTVLPPTMFQGTGQNFTTMGQSTIHHITLFFFFLLMLDPVRQGFEYWSNPSDPTSGYIEWQVNGSPTARMGASAVGPDQDATVGSGVGQRIIPVEPMVRAF